MNDNAGNTSGNVEIIPGMTKPDQKYRNKACFGINKKELREFTRKGVLPERVTLYKKAVKEETVYMKHGTHLVFRTK